MTTSAPTQNHQQQVGATTAEVAARFGVTAQTVRTLALAGRIPHYRLGARLRFDLDEVEEALRVPAVRDGEVPDGQ